MNFRMIDTEYEQAEISKPNTIRQAVRDALDPDNLAGVPIPETDATLRAVGPLPLPTENLDWIISYLTERVLYGTLPKGTIVFNRYAAWITS